jgi:DNA repair exonuclease SbcCD ATPase subunit
MISEAKVREADLSGDRKSKWGSKEHISDLEKRIEELTYWRNKQKKGSDARANYSRIITRLKGDLSSAKKKLAQISLKEQNKKKKV